MLTPTRGPTSPEGSFLGFQTPEKSLGLPVAPGLEEAGMLTGSPGSGFMKANWEGKSRLTLPRVCARDGREEPRLWGPTPKMPQPPPNPFLGSHPKSGCCSPHLRARRRGYLHRSTRAPGQGVISASPDQQHPDLLSCMLIFS